MYTTPSKFVSSNRDFNQTLCWRMLSDDQCEEIFVSALELLERSGAVVENEEARSILGQGGCWIQGNMVRIPSAKLEWAIRTAPSRLTLCNREGKRAVLMETENVHFGCGYGARKIFDRQSGERRNITLEDIADTARLSEKLDHISFISPMGLPVDCPDDSAELYALEQLLLHSTKPIVQPVDSEKKAVCAMEMASVASGGMQKLQRDPYLVLSVTCDEPRYHNNDVLSVVLFSAKNRIPLIYNNKLVSGQTAPASPAGTLVLALSNYLVALTLSQMTNEHTPIIAGGQFTIYDIKNEVAPFGAPEAALIGAGFANLMRWLRLPSAGIAGISDSAISDAQSGAESAIGLLTAALAGTNLILGGMLESGKTMSLPVLAMSEETMAEIYRMMRSFAIDEDRKAVGVYDVVGPGGSYLGEEHTSLFFKPEQYWPNLFSRLRVDDWRAAGSKSMQVRAGEYVNLLLSTPDALLCDKSTAAAIKKVLSKVDQDVWEMEG